MINVGDLVKIKNAERRYPLYTEWFVRNRDHIKLEWMIKYLYECDKDSEFIIDTSDEYEVLYVEDDKALICSATSQPYCNTYLFDVEALDSNICEMTMEEIEEKLGCKVRIVPSKE